jgi:hypothetical protein
MPIKIQNIVWRTFTAVAVAFTLNAILNLLALYDGCGFYFSLGESQPDECISYSDKYFGFYSIAIFLLTIIVPNIFLVYVLRKWLTLRAFVCCFLIVIGFSLALFFTHSIVMQKFQ